MKSSGKTGLFVPACTVAALLSLLGACEQAPDFAADESAKASLPPAIVPPTDEPNAAEPPSYEVGIATAAAEHNRAKEQCAEKSERLQALCDAEAAAAFVDAKADLEDLRGNQQ